MLFAVVTATVCLCYGCKEMNHAPAAQDANAQKYKAANGEIYKAIETGDVSKLDSFIAKDAVDHGAGGPQDLVGLEGIKKMLGSMHNQFKNLKMERLSTAVDGDIVFERVRMTGTCTSADAGMPVGTNIDMTSIDVTKWKDGKAVEHWSYMDPRDMMKMMPPPPPPATK